MLAVALLLTTLALTALVSGPDRPAAAEAPAPRSMVGAGGYHPVTPTRILDSRTSGVGVEGTWGPGHTRQLDVTGPGGVPDDATAVALNVTVTGGTAASDLRLWPNAIAQPQVSSLNWLPGETVPNLVVVGVGAGGRVNIRNQAGEVHVIADLVGWYGPAADPTGALYRPVAPTRVQDSRKPDVGLEGAWAPAQTRVLDLDDVTTVPADATAVAIGITATEGTAASDLRVWPTAGAGGTTSTLNWVAGQTRPNVALVPLDAQHQISLRNTAGEVHVIADVVGWFTRDGDALTIVQPTRIQDSRKAAPGLAGPWSAGQVRELPVVGSAGVPETASAVVVNVTVTGGTAASNLRLWASDRPVPGTSNLNWAEGQTVAALAVVEIGDGGAIAIRNHSGSVHVVVDVIGYLSPRPFDDPLTGVAEVDLGGSACARMLDATLRCWGPNASGQLGIGTTTARLSPVEVPGLDDVAQVSVGSQHACVRHADATASCWGENEHGQLGDGTTTDRSSPTPVTGLADVAEIRAGGRHTCARLTDGTVTCWGDNSDGQLGDGTTTDRLTPHAVPALDGVAQVTVGDEHTCARLGDGTASCWGDDSRGQLGDAHVPAQPTLVDRWSPTPVEGLDHLVQLDAGVDGTCGLDGDAVVWCWGLAFSDEHGFEDPVSVPAAFPGLDGATQVSSGGYRHCALLPTGVSCWVFPDEPPAVAVAGLDDPVVVVAGPDMACALEADTTLRCWGSGTTGLLGDGTRLSRPTAAPVLDLPRDGWLPPAPRGLTAVAGNGRVTLTWQAVAATDLAGYDLYRSTSPAQLGTRVNAALLSATTYTDAGLTNGVAVTYHVVARDLDDNESLPSLPATATPDATPLTGVASVAAGANHSCAAMAEGTARCWGIGNRGQLGDGAVSARAFPVTVVGLDDVEEVGAGSDWTCALRGDGTVRCWGRNVWGIGDGTTIQRNTPVVVTGISTATQLSVGSNHACARLADGTARCWGRNESSQLGDGTTTSRPAPVAVAGLGGIEEIRVGMGHTCARLTDATVRCWGLNAKGQLGDGTTTNRPAPTAVAGVSGVVQLAASSGRTCARLGDGTVTCWGRSVGVGGAEVIQLAPTMVPDLDHAIAVSVSYEFACAVRDDGTVGCWGSDTNRELGNGPTTGTPAHTRRRRRRHRRDLDQHGSGPLVCRHGDGAGVVLGWAERARARDLRSLRRPRARRHRRGLTGAARDCRGADRLRRDPQPARPLLRGDRPG